MNREPAVMRYLAVVGKATLAEHFARFGDSPTEGLEARLAWARDLHLSGVKQAEALLLYRDVALIREALRREIAPRPRGGPVGQARGLSQLAGVDELVGGDQPMLEIADLVPVNERGVEVAPEPRVVEPKLRRPEPVEAPNAPRVSPSVTPRAAPLPPTVSPWAPVEPLEKPWPPWVAWALLAGLVLGAAGVAVAVFG